MPLTCEGAEATRLRLNTHTTRFAPALTFQARLRIFASEVPRHRNLKMPLKPFAFPV